MNKCRRERILVKANQEEAVLFDLRDFRSQGWFSVWGMIWIIWREKNLIALWLGGGWWQEQRDGARKQAAAGFFSPRNCKLKWQLQIQNKTNANAKICKNTK